MVVIQHWIRPLILSLKHIRPEIRVQLCKAATDPTKIPPEPGALVRQIKEMPDCLQQIKLKTIRLSDVSSIDISIPLQLSSYGGA